MSKLKACVVFETERASCLHLDYRLPQFQKSVAAVLHSQDRFPSHRVVENDEVVSMRILQYVLYCLGSFVHGSQMQSEV